MSCFLSARIKQWRTNKEIENLLKTEKRIARRESMVLFLGTKESGKSTFIKQMKIMHGSGYTYDEKKDYTKIIFQNIFIAMQFMLKAMESFNISLEHDCLQEKSDEIKNMSYETVSEMGMEWVKTLKNLWKDKGVVEIYERRREYELPDSTEYFLSDLDRIGSPDYVPTEQDILRARVPTIGINEYKFEFDHTIFRMVDVGGLKSERRKWMLCFENVRTIIFVVALSEYDQISLESNNESRMQKSIALFQRVIAQHWLGVTSIILFMNKHDIFADKILTSHLSDYFGEYQGPRKDCLAARKFILDRLYPTEILDRGRWHYSHFTCATDTDHIKFIFYEVKEEIWRSNFGTGYTLL